MEKICIVCGGNFYKKVNTSKKNWLIQKYCSRKCSLTKTGIRHQKNLDLARVNWKSWNKGMKYDDTMKSRLDLTGFAKGRMKGIKRPEATGEKHWRWKPKIVKGN